MPSRVASAACLVRVDHRVPAVGIVRQRRATAAAQHGAQEQVRHARPVGPSPSRAGSSGRSSRRSSSRRGGPRPGPRVGRLVSCQSIAAEALGLDDGGADTSDVPHAPATRATVARIAMSRWPASGAVVMAGSRATAEGSARSGEDGAGDEVRTRDMQLGRLPLCQLSYSRPRREVYQACYTT